MGMRAQHNNMYFRQMQIICYIITQLQINVSHTKLIVALSLSENFSRDIARFRRFNSTRQGDARSTSIKVT
jgi:hypothetical protein